MVIVLMRVGRWGNRMNTDDSQCFNDFSYSPSWLSLTSNKLAVWQNAGSRFNYFASSRVSSAITLGPSGRTPSPDVRPLSAKPYIKDPRPPADDVNRTSPSQHGNEGMLVNSWRPWETEWQYFAHVYVGRAKLLSEKQGFFLTFACSEIWMLISTDCEACVSFSCAFREPSWFTLILNDLYQWRPLKCMLYKGYIEQWQGWLCTCAHRNTCRPNLESPNLERISWFNFVNSNNNCHSSYCSALPEATT